MKLVTWNVNSLRIRLSRVQAWIQQHQPDVLCLQETKCPDAQFPRAELEGLGYHVEISGQKGLNGVAILSKAPMTDVLRALPGKDDDRQKRFIAATVDGVRVFNGYIPNGQKVGSEAFFYKLDWLGRLQAHLVQTHDPSQEIAVVGDFNIAPDDRDVHDPVAFKDRLHCTTHERRAIEYLEGWGLSDALRAKYDDGERYSWFDYRNDGIARNEGLRIDLILLTEPLLARLEDVTIDLDERKGEKPSDHAPVVAELRPR